MLRGGRATEKGPQREAWVSVAPGVSLWWAVATAARPSWEKAPCQIMQSTVGDEGGAVSSPEARPCLPVMVTSGLDLGGTIWAPTATASAELTRLKTVLKQNRRERGAGDLPPLACVAVPCFCSSKVTQTGQSLPALGRSWP